MKFFRDQIADGLGERRKHEAALQKHQAAYEIKFIKGKGWVVFYPLWCVFDEYEFESRSMKKRSRAVMREMSSCAHFMDLKRGIGYPSLDPKVACQVALEAQQFMPRLPIMLIDEEEQEIYEITEDTVVEVVLRLLK